MFGMIKKIISQGGSLISEQNMKCMRNILDSESLSCNKCNSLSVPLYLSENKYKCTKCGRQFSGSRHNIRNVINRRFGADMKKTYDKCVNEIELIENK